MHFYSLSYDGLLAVPIKTFWFMNQCIDRIEAHKDMRSLSVAVCGQGGGQAAQQHRERLVIEAGDVIKVKFDPIKTAVRDDEGFKALKEMIQL